VEERRNSRDRLILKLCDDVKSELEDISVVVDLILENLGCLDGFLFFAYGHGVDEQKLREKGRRSG